MTAPSTPETVAGYELYRVILDYEALQDGFLDRIDDLNTTQEQIELAAGFARGNVQRLLSKNPGKPSHVPRNHRHASTRRTFGWESLGKMLEKTGLALVLVVDDGRFAGVKGQLMQRKRVRQPANGGSARPTWLFSKEKAREMGKKRFSLMTPKQRKKHQRKAGRASAKARRRKSAAPTASRAAESGSAGIVRHAGTAAVTAVQALDCAK